MLRLLVAVLRSGQAHPDELPRPEDLPAIRDEALRLDGLPRLLGELIASYAQVARQPASPAGVVAGRARHAGGTFAHTYRWLRSDMAFMRVAVAMVGLAPRTMRVALVAAGQLAVDVAANARPTAEHLDAVAAVLGAEEIGIALQAEPVAGVAGAWCIHTTGGDRTPAEVVVALAGAGAVHGHLGLALARTSLGPGGAADGAVRGAAGGRAGEISWWEVARRLTPATRALALALIADPSTRSVDDVVALGERSGLPARTMRRVLPLLDERLQPLRDALAGPAAGSAIPTPGSAIPPPSALRPVPDPLGAVYVLADLLVVAG